MDSKTNEITIMHEVKDDFYQSLRRKISDYLNTDGGKKYKFAEYLLIAPDLFHLLCRLTFDKDVSVADKAKLAVAIAYFVSPVDLIPDVLLPVGYIDDVGIAAFVLNSIINNTNPEIVEKYWTGEKNILEVIKSILKTADEMIGAGVWQKIKAMFNKQAEKEESK